MVLSKLLSINITVSSVSPPDDRGECAGHGGRLLWVSAGDGRDGRDAPEGDLRDRRLSRIAVCVSCFFF